MEHAFSLGYVAKLVLKNSFMDQYWSTPQIFEKQESQNYI